MTPKHTILTAEPRQDNWGIWRISEDDLAAYLEQAYKDTQERIASGQIPPGDEAAEDTVPA